MELNELRLSYPRSQSVYVDLWPVEAADQDTFHQNVSIHCLHHIALRCFRAESELGIQREEFERVVMIRTDGSGPIP